MAFSPNGKLLAYSTDLTVVVRNWSARRQLWQSKAHLSQLTTLRFTSDGEKIFSANQVAPRGGREPDQKMLKKRSCSIYIWDVTNGKLLEEKSQRSVSSKPLEISPNCMFYTMQDNDERSGEAVLGMNRVYVPLPAQLWPTASCFLSDNSLLFASDGTLYLTNNKLDKLQKQWKLLRDVQHIAVSPDGQYAAMITEGAPAVVQIMNLKTGQELWDGTDVFSRIYRSRPTEAGFHIQGLNKKGNYSFIDLQSGKFTSVPTLTMKRKLAAPSPNGKVVATVSENGLVQLTDVVTGRVRWKVQGKPIAKREEGFQSRIQFSADSRQLLIANPTQATVLDVATGRQITQMRWKDQRGLLDLDWSKDSRRLVGLILASMRFRLFGASEIQIRDAERGAMGPKIQVKGELRRVAFSPDR